MSDPAYKDEDLVYVDPKKKAIISLVNFKKDGNVEPLEMVFDVKEKDEGKEDGPPKKALRKPKKRFYLWGTYKTMKKLYRIEGKERETESYIDLNKAIDLSMEEPYWDL